MDPAQGAVAGFFVNGRERRVGMSTLSGLSSGTEADIRKVSPVRIQ